LANRNDEAAAYKMSPRTPVEAGALQVRSHVYLVVEVETQPR
jgi:hypothetical protein